ncbi:MAG: hypothetical protein ACKO6K_05180, partial [Chitinophagaceae bacterium]
DCLIFMYEKSLPSNRTGLFLFTIRFPGEHLSPVPENFKKNFRPYPYLHLVQVNRYVSLTLISTPKKSRSNSPARPGPSPLKTTRRISTGTPAGRESLKIVTN